jgi:hypothetical protein
VDGLTTIDTDKNVNKVHAKCMKDLLLVVEKSDSQNSMDELAILLSFIREEFERR